MDRASSSDALGPGFEPRPLRFKKYHFFTPKRYPLGAVKQLKLLIMVWVVWVKMAQFARNYSNCSKLLNLLKIGGLGVKSKKSPKKGLGPLETG